MILDTLMMTVERALVVDTIPSYCTAHVLMRFICVDPSLGISRVGGAYLSMKL